MSVCKVSEVIAMLQENHEPNDVILIEWLSRDEMPVRVGLGQGVLLDELEWSKCLEQIDNYELFDETLINELRISALKIIREGMRDDFRVR